MRSKPLNRNLVNLTIDAVTFLGFLIATAPRFSGLAIHEWLGIAFGAAIVTHLLLHWQWIIQVTRRFFDKVTWNSRINYLLNILLFVDATLITFTGLMISEVALPFVGVSTAREGVWRGLHSLSSNLGLALIGLHLALHWRWIVNMFGRFVAAPRPGQRRAPEAKLAATSARKEVVR